MAENVSLFKVIDIVKRTGINKYGEMKDYYQIYFETKSGIKSDIMIPVDTKKEDIGKILTKEAEKLEYMRNLKV